MQRPDTDLLPEEYEKIDWILDDVHDVMIDVSRELRIREPRFERWRWDVPEVRTSWGPPSRQGINRNVIFLVTKVDDGDYRGVIDINAWLDESYAGLGMRRSWQNQSFSDIPVSQRSGYATAIRAAFATVLEWGRDQLQRQELIASTP